MGIDAPQGTACMKSIRISFVYVLVSLVISTTWSVALVRLPALAPAQSVECSRPSRELVRRELVFGTARPHDDPLSESEWQAFLDSVVTPRFPDGFTVLSGVGQWRGQDGLTKEQSRILVVWHERSPNRDADIEAIRSAYKSRFDQESVLRIDSVSCVSF
jgi:hypothetical protein